MRHLNHSADIVRQLGDLNGQITELIARNKSLELEIVERQNSIIWQMTMRFHNSFVERALPQSTGRRKIYNRWLKGGRILLNEGPNILWKKYNNYRMQNETELDNYEQWCSINEPTSLELEKQREFANNLTYRPLISIITPIYNISPTILEATIKSVIDQTYNNWEMCLVDGNSNDGNIKKCLEKLVRSDRRIKAKYLDHNLGISGNSNESLKLAKGEFVAFLDHDDLFAPFALFEVAKVLNKDKSVDFIYSDRDLVTKEGNRRFKPFFKPDWSPDIMLSANYLTHICVIRKSLIDDIGGLASETDGAQDWDLFLKIAERTNKIYHIPKILYHWRDLKTSCAMRGETAKPYIFEAQRLAIQDHLRRMNKLGKVILESTGFWRVKWMIEKNHKVSIIIPTRDNINMLRRCIDAIFLRSFYKNFELIVIDTGCRKEENRRYYDEISKNDKIKILKYDDKFNYSAVNNIGARYATGDILLFLNDDVEIITPDWIEEMLGWAEKEEIGVVGAKLLKPNRTIQHAGVVIGMQGFAGHPFSGLAEDYYGISGSTEWYRNYLAVTGACMMIRRAVFEEINGFDEMFELNGSDVELCLRAWKKGYRVVYTPFARLIHYEGATREKYLKQIPKNDFHTSYKHYEPFIKNGDPYYNVNLSPWSTVPRIRMPDEREVMDFVKEVLKNGVE